MRHRILIYVAVAVAMGLAACSGGEEKSVAETANTQEIVAMAQQAAQGIADSDRNDTLAIQNAIMEARAQRSALAIAGRKEAALAYDEALQARLHELDPQLCDLIFGTQEKAEQ